MGNDVEKKGKDIELEEETVFETVVEEEYLVLGTLMDNTLSFYSLIPMPTTSSNSVEETATASNATSSNASGTPTPSKSAIPMAVAMLAGLMAIAPKLFEDSENKNRKER